MNVNDNCSALEDMGFEWVNHSKLGYDILNKKYFHEDETFEEWIGRVSNENDDVKKLIESKKFLFGGRVLANRNVKNTKLTLSNCYVITPPEDNIESIFEACSKLARTYSYGGGCGVDISKLRPNGALTHNASKYSSGPVSFMDLFSQVTGTISQNGRRGALMISMDVNHPDVEEFIDCKTDLSRVNFANISIRTNDKFMNAAMNDEDYILHYPCDSTKEYVPEEYNTLVMHCGEYYKKVRAKDLFIKLAKNNWAYAEPGILYWDRVQNYNILDGTDFEYGGVNPCAEEPLPPGGSCLLGSLNLAAFVKDEFEDNASFDFDDFERSIDFAINALNDVLDEGLKLHPLEEQRNTVTRLRQIGLGTMGLADMLIKMRVVYGSDESLVLIENVYNSLSRNAVLASSRRAEKYGTYPDYKSEVLNSNFLKHIFRNHPEQFEYVKKHGLNNSQILTCAPTGSIATMIGVSTGVEPVYAMKYTRTTKSLNDKDTTYEVYTPIAAKYLETHDSLPEYFVESSQIAPEKRIMVQEILQNNTDAAISSTINLPKETTVEDVYNIYVDAWKHNLKGVTVFRSGCSRQAILTTEDKHDEEGYLKRPKSVNAEYFPVKIKGEQFAVLIGYLNDAPYEIFAIRPDKAIEQHKGVISKKSKGVYSFKSDLITVDNVLETNINIEEKSATLYISMLLRHNIPLKYIIKTAKKANPSIVSFSSAICRILGKFVEAEVTDEVCPFCGGKMIKEGGCMHCENGDYSKCGD